MAEQKPITINNFQQGVSKSPYTGFSAMYNLNTSVNGAISQNPKMVAQTSLDGLVRWTTYDNSGDRWELTSKGKLYKNGTLVPGNTLESSTEYTGCGLAYYNGYIYTANSTRVERYEIATTTWTTSWQNWSNSNMYDTYHQMIVGIDDILYIAAGNVVSTYNGTTWTESKVTLPKQSRVRCMTTLGDNILLGTVRYDNVIAADIYVWNRTANLADSVIKIKENGVFQMITKNNTVYAVCGNNATLYSTVGSGVNKLISFADYIREDDDTSLPNYTGYSQNIHRITYNSYQSAPSIHPAAINVIANKLLIGLCDTTVDTAGLIYPYGVWSYDTENGAVVLEYSLNITRTYSKTMEIGCIDASQSGSIRASWRKDVAGTPSYGIDSVSTTFVTAFHSNYEDYFETAIYQVGLTNTKRTFNTLTVQLSKKLLPTQGIQIKYRNYRSDNWTTLGTLATTGMSSKEFPFAVSCELLQIRVEFSGTNEGTSPFIKFSPELLSIIIK